MNLTVKINAEGLDEAKLKADALMETLQNAKRLWIELSELINSKPELIGDELFLCGGKHIRPASE